MKIKSFEFHRKEQWDLDDLKPLVCIHKEYDGGNGCVRILCLGFRKWKPFILFTNPFKFRY